MDDSQPATHDLAPDDPSDSLDGSFGLSLSAFPRLRRLLMHEGEAARAELLEFAQALHYKRAPRLRRSLVARVYTEYSDVPEVAVVHDLSLTGVRLWVDGERTFDAARGDPYTMEVRIPGSRDHVEIEAELVRVAENRLKRGVELAFRFVGGEREPRFQELLAQLESETT